MSSMWPQHSAKMVATMKRYMPGLGMLTMSRSSSGKPTSLSSDTGTLKMFIISTNTNESSSDHLPSASMMKSMR